MMWIIFQKVSMFGRMFVICLSVSVVPLAAGVIRTSAYGSSGPINVVAVETIANAPLSTNFDAWTHSGDSYLSGGFDLLFPAVSVPAGNSITSLVLWMFGTYVGWSESTNVTPVIADCSGVPCPFHGTSFGGFPGGPYGWGTILNLYGIASLRSDYAVYPLMVNVSGNPTIASAVGSGTPLTLHAGWQVDYEGLGEILLNSGYNAVTKTTFVTAGGTGISANLEVHFEETVPEPGTGGLFCLTLACAAGWLTRTRLRHTATR